MNALEKQEYNRLRRKEWPAGQAYRAAKVRERWRLEEWDEITNEGRVRVVCEPEEEDLRVFEPDFENEKQKKEWYALIEREGIWFYRTQYRVSDTAPWEEADGIGGIEGNWTDCGYDIDLMSSALDKLEEALEDGKKHTTRTTIVTTDGVEVSRHEEVWSDGQWKRIE